MTWTKCIFEPLDVIGCADARPLEDGGWGHDGFVSGSAFAGSLRTRILQDNEYDFTRNPEQTPDATKAAEAVGVPDFAEQGVFQFAGPFGATCSWKHSLLFAMPRTSLFDAERDREGRLEIDAAPTLSDEALSGLHLLRPSVHEMATDDRWTPLGDLCARLGAPAGANWVGGPYSASELWSFERRTGHEREKTGVVKDGQLFSRSVLRCAEKRFSEWHGSEPVAPRAAFGGLLRGVDNYLPTGSQTIVRLGGDGYRATVSFSDASDELSCLDTLKKSVKQALNDKGQGLLLYLATHAVFKGGWNPGLDESSGVRLIAAAVGKPVILSGWNQKRRRPKPMRRAVPAGSVYYYEVVDTKKAERLVDTYHFDESLGENTGQYGLVVFGHFDLSDQCETREGA
jgi:hypothetical protein